MKHKKLSARILSLALSATMLFSMMPTTVFATGGDIPIGASNVECHVEHDKDCGFMEAVEGADCSHKNEDGTYSCVSETVSDNTASPGDADKTVCTHEDDCGYVEAVEGVDCKHSCASCKTLDSGNAGKQPVQEPCTCDVLCAADVMSADCPICSVENADFATLCKGEAVALLVAPRAAPTTVSTWAELQGALFSGGEIQLTANITAGPTDLFLNAPLETPYTTIDLNGYTIDRGLTAATSDGHVFRIDAGLTLTDTSASGIGKITGGNNSDGPGGILTTDYYDMGSTFIMEGGTISGNTGTTVGGVNVVGDFTVGGTAKVEGNTADSEGNKVASNVYLPTGKVIKQSTSRPLTDGAKIGVTLEDKTGAFTDANATWATHADKFFSDDPKYSVAYDAGTQQLKLVAGPSIIVAAQTGTATYGTVASPTFDVTSSSFDGTYPAFAPKVEWVGTEPTGVTEAFTENNTKLTLTTTAATPAGKHKFKVVSAKADTGNYESAEATLTIGKATPTVTVEVTKKPAVRAAIGDKNDTFIIKATVAGPTGSASPTGTVIFKENGTVLNTSAATVTNSVATYEWTTPNAKDNYTITADYTAATEEKNYVNASGTSGGFDISKGEQAALTISGVPATVSYGDASFTLSTTGGSGTGAVTYAVTTGDAVSVDASTGAVTVSKVGTATITATKAGDDNYNAKTATVTITVGKKALTTLTIDTITGQTYTGSQLTPTPTVKDGTTALVSTDFTVTYGTNVDAGTGAGSLTVKAAANGNYTFTDTDKTFDIDKGTYTGTAVTGSKDVLQNKTANNVEFDLSTLSFPDSFKDKSFKTSSYSANTDGVLTGTPTITGTTLKFDVGSVAKDKTGVIDVVVGSKNYNDYNAQITVKTVDKTPVAITGLTKADATYDGNAKTGYTGTPIYTPAGFTGTLEYTYYKDSVATANKLTGAPTNVGSYIVVAAIPDSNTAYMGSVQILFSIAKGVYTGTQASAPSDTPASKTDTDITLKAVTPPTDEAVEYAKSTTNVAPTDDSAWQDSTIFSGLDSDKEYYFFARVKDNANHKAGTASTGTKIKTDLSDTDKLAAAKSKAAAALDAMTATNVTTDADVLTAVNNALSGTGIAAAWKTGSGFTKTEATKDTAGSITGIITLTLNGKAQDITVTLTIKSFGAQLTDAIAAANTAKNGITVSDSPASSVTSGTKFVNTAEMKALNDAIVAAQLVADNAAATEAEVTAAVTALNNAVATFNAAIKTGTYSASSNDNSSTTGTTIKESLPPSYTGGTKIIGDVRVPDYTIEGQWRKNENGKWDFSGNGGEAYKNCWAPVYNPYADVTKGQKAFDWFKFDASGMMITGWHTDVDGNTYYLNPNLDNTQGAMRTGWVLIDGKYYYFNEMPDGTRGRLFKDTKTPDGYLVDKNGVWNGSGNK